ncbi:MAG: hypothetical protein U1E84_17225 [Rhodoferax sp.]
MALATLGICQMLAVVLNQGVQLAAAYVQNPGKIQGNVSGMLGIRMAKIIRPVVEKLPLIGSFFRYFDGFFLHGKRRLS